MTNNSKWILLGTLSAGVLGGLYMLINNKQEVKVQLTRHQVVLYLKDLKNQTVSQFVTNAGVIKRMIKETGGKYDLGNGKTVADYIRNEVQNIFDEKKNLLFAKHGITENQLISAVDVGFKNDEEIFKLTRDIFDGFEDSLKGIEPSIEVQPKVLEILTKEKTLILLKKIMVQSSKWYLQVFKELIQEGETELTLKNPQFQKKLGKLNMQGKKKKIIENEGVFLEPESPTECLGKVCQKYRDEDEEFANQINDINHKFTDILQRYKEIENEEEIDRLFE